MANSQDAHYLSLLALAEKFRTEEPPNIRACVQCLQAVLNFQPPPKVEGRTHLQLGNLLVHYTTNTELAQTHLQQAWTLCLNIPGFDDVKFEAASKLAKLYEQMNAPQNARLILNQAIEVSRSNVVWHSSLLLQSAQLSLRQKDLSGSTSSLQMGLEYSHMQGHSYNQLLFNLSKLMVTLLEGKPLNEVQSSLNMANQSIEQYNGPSYQKEQLKIYFLILLVCHSLNIGQVKTVKPTLKQLQQCIQNLAEHTNNDSQVANNPDLLVLLPRDQLCVLVYLVSVMHSVQAGYMDKAHKYIEKALPQISKLKVGNDFSTNKFLNLLEVVLLEHSVISHLITGSKANAIKELLRLCSCLRRSPSIMQKYEGQVHILLAIYSMSMNNNEAAQLQFNSALRVTENRDVWSFANLNLAMVYLRYRNERELSAILDRIQPENLATHSDSLRAAAYYVQGLHAFYTNRYDHGKSFLRESLKMAYAEDLNRLTSCSLVLLGHIFLALNSHQEACNMVSPAMQLASKIPDLHLQLWASAILEVIFRQSGHTAQEQEHRTNHANFSQILLNDHKVASQLPEHQLINWTEGPIPAISI